MELERSMGQRPSNHWNLTQRKFTKKRCTGSNRIASSNCWDQLREFRRCMHHVHHQLFWADSKVRGKPIKNLLHSIEKWVQSFKPKGWQNLVLVTTVGFPTYGTFWNFLCNPCSEYEIYSVISPEFTGKIKYNGQKSFQMAEFPAS